MFASGAGSTARAVRAVDWAGNAGRRGLGKLGGFWRNVSGQIHGVMENARDLDDLSRCSAIHDEMSSSSAVACDVEAAEIGKDFVARDARRGGIRAPLRRQ